MKFLLIGFVVIVAIIGILIIALTYFSARSKKKEDGTEISQASTSQGAKRIFWPVIVIILLGLVVFAGFKMIKGHSLPVYQNQIAYQIAADAQDIWPQIGEIVKIKIYPDRLSGWINLPPGVKFTIDAPGEIEYFFWTGERTLIKDKNTEWFGEVSSCSFRLRGKEGEATITVQ